ncbi:MAG: hypothetical protein K2N94_03525 [Lachnospiraceae bacterium]|nr:hypothetical protein [Lachnospiraceae bacterium]
MSNRKFRRYTAAAAAAALTVCVPVHSVPALATAAALSASDTVSAAAPVPGTAAETALVSKAGTATNPGSVPEAGRTSEGEPGSEKDLSPVTTTVERGTLSVTAQVSATLQYFDWGTIWFDSDYASAVFVQYCVKEGDYVEKGQPVAEVQAQVNDIDIEAAKLRLTRARQEQEELHESCSERLAAAEKAVSESSGTARRIAELDLEKCRMETERSLRSVDERVAALEEQITGYDQAREKLLILSPMTGYLHSFEPMEAGKIVWKGDRIGLMYGRKEQTYAVTDATGILCYGMRAQFAEKNSSNTSRGMVVSCSQKYLSSAFKTDNAYIRFDSRSEDPYYATVSYESLHLENVLIVKLEAVKSDSYGSYVTELKDGRKIKHYFLMGKRTKDYCHVLDGLTEGMVVVIN